MSSLNKDIVLVLNKNWQAINISTTADALSMMYSNTATGLDIRGKDDMVPLTWKQWVDLSCSEDDHFVKTIQGNVKIPKIIILCRYDKVPKKRPKITRKGIWIRDQGICQYTGKKINPNEGNIDHVIPKSRGGATDWTNCVLAHKKVNAKKADRTPEEAGLKLIRQPYVPKELPVSFYLTNKYNIQEWELFLNSKS
jgi:5-methylcytosine-specific restriction endonuclease McrA